MEANKPVYKILVIDDEEDLRDIIEYQFKSKGYHVTLAKDGIEGLGKLQIVNPDLIVLDLNMPRMGGIEFYQKICGPDGRPSHHILVLTARANTRQLFLDFDVDGFMTKPFEAEQLLKEAEIILSRSRRDSAVKRTARINGSKNIFVVDHQQDDLGKIAASLLSAGYKVSTASNGSKAIEKMMQDVPDIALVNLGLTDIPGDIVVQRLMHMSKTMDIKFVLYVHRNFNHDKVVLEGFSRKPGVLAFFEYDSTGELLETVDNLVIKEKENEHDH